LLNKVFRKNTSEYFETAEHGAVEKQTNENYLLSVAAKFTVSFSRRTLLHGVSK
jgi:hypothetical protein